MPAKSVPYSSVLAANLKAARARLGVTQASCAARMKALGFDWYPQTVGNTERGSRRLAAEELLGLAYALETTIASLTAASEDDQLVELPSGAIIAAASVRKSVGGTKDFAVQWDGDKPVIPPAVSEMQGPHGTTHMLRGGGAFAPDDEDGG